MQQNSQKTWLGALAHAVRALAMTLVKLFSVTNEVLEIAESAVETAREKQAVDLTISMAHYASTALANASMNQSKVFESVEEYIKQDPTGDRKKRVDSAHKELTALVNQELARIKAARAVEE